jgi:hypothetical protein
MHGMLIIVVSLAPLRGLVFRMAAVVPSCLTLVCGELWLEEVVGGAGPLEQGLVECWTGAKLVGVEARAVGMLLAAERGVW